MAINTGRLSVRYPDVSVVCGDAAQGEDDSRMGFDHASVVFEVLSPEAMLYDQTVKLPEYQRIDAVQTIVLLDPDSE
jgi:Uma2 family endonuclease